MNADPIRARRLKIQLEVLSWLITALVAFLVINPLLTQFTEYPFLYANLLFVAVFCTYARFLFLLRHTFLAPFQWLKVLLIFASIPLVFHLISLMSDFQDAMDSESLGRFEQYFRAGVEYPIQQRTLGYMQREMVFFGVGAIISAALLPFRLLVSVWRVYNKTGTV